MDQVTLPYQELIAQCEKGDSRAQISFYEQHYKPVFTTCLRIVGNKVEAEDLMQETFITAFAKLSSLGNKAKVTGWLCTIARNKSINYIQRERKTWVDIKDHDSPAIDDDYKEIDVAYIYKGIKELPEGYRTIMNLYLFEGMNHEQIGTSLGISASTSRSQYARAKQRLRQIIEQHYD
ncbi:MAG: RNA polymerase sigma factor (sigma-70 family) [Flavobacteriales bacterium]|jgi:RNA polymerase sigma factor (sigma-70 family)